MVITAIAAKGAYVPDNLVCAGDLPTGRPTPLMMWCCFADLGICHPATVVKVDDTEVGIEEGLNAGTWTVGVSVSGNAMDLPLADGQALAPVEQATRRDAAEAKLRGAGAHNVVDSAAEMPPCSTPSPRGEQPGRGNATWEPGKASYNGQPPPGRAGPPRSRLSGDTDLGRRFELVADTRREVFTHVLRNGPGCIGAKLVSYLPTDGVVQDQQAAQLRECRRVVVPCDEAVARQNGFGNAGLHERHLADDCFAGGPAGRGPAAVLPSGWW